MKKLVTILMCALFIFGTASPVLAAEEIVPFVNPEQVILAAWSSWSPMQTYLGTLKQRAATAAQLAGILADLAGVPEVPSFFLGLAADIIIANMTDVYYKTTTRVRTDSSTMQCQEEIKFYAYSNSARTIQIGETVIYINTYDIVNKIPAELA